MNRPVVQTHSLRYQLIQHKLSPSEVEKKTHQPTLQEAIFSDSSFGCYELFLNDTTNIMVDYLYSRYSHFDLPDALLTTLESLSLGGSEYPMIEYINLLKNEPWYGWGRFEVDLYSNSHRVTVVLYKTVVDSDNQTQYELFDYCYQGSESSVLSIVFGSDGCAVIRPNYMFDIYPTDTECYSMEVELHDLLGSIISINHREICQFSEYKYRAYDTFKFLDLDEIDRIPTTIANVFNDHTKQRVLLVMNPKTQSRLFKFFESKEYKIRSTLEDLEAHHFKFNAEWYSMFSYEFVVFIFNDHQHVHEIANVHMIMVDMKLDEIILFYFGVSDPVDDIHNVQRFLRLMHRSLFKQDLRRDFRIKNFDNAMQHEKIAYPIQIKDGTRRYLRKMRYSNIFPAVMMVLYAHDRRTERIIRDCHWEFTSILYRFRRIETEKPKWTRYFFYPNVDLEQGLMKRRFATQRL